LARRSEPLFNAARAAIDAGPAKFDGASLESAVRNIDGATLGDAVRNIDNTGVDPPRLEGYWSHTVRSLAAGAERRADSPSSVWGKPTHDGASDPKDPSTASERVAQSVEHLTFNQRVPGSSPGALTNKNK
jgi:hypothetical protein